MSDPIPAQEAQQIADQNNPQQGAVLPPQQAAEVQEQQPEAIEAKATLGAPSPAPEVQQSQKPKVNQAEEIDKTIRGLLIQVIALQHNKEASQQQA